MMIRKAGLDDVDWLIEQVRAFEKFAGYKRTLLENEIEGRKVMENLVRAHVVLVAEEKFDHVPSTPETRRGFIAGYFTPHPFNLKLKVLSEVFWWVPEKYRGSSAGAKLLLEFEDVGRRFADWVIFSLEHNSPIRADHLTKRGFREVERAFLLEV